MADVFISYKKEEAAIAQRVIRALESQGFTTWWDDRIVPAEQWDATIEGEIAISRVVMVLWTKASAKSQWVRSEAQYALEHRKLLPLLMEECSPPLAFSLVQAINLSRWNGAVDHALWRKVTAYLHDIMKGASRVRDAAPAQSARAEDWRGGFGKHVNGEPILIGETVTTAAQTGTVFKDGAELPLMCVIGAGGFNMGSARGAPESRESEYPQRRVDIAKFAIGVYPVTLDEWDAARRAGGVSYQPHDQGWGRGRMPAINVSWNDAQLYARWLCGRTGERYRLPSEAEWEYACRAASDDAFSFDGALTPETAAFKQQRSAPVGSYPPNRFGLYDMHGNVREWVEDSWHDNYVDAPRDGIPWTSGHSAMRVVRGGSWQDEAWFLRSASRGRASAPDRCSFIGFRVARDLS
ncbi:MAG TPA: SUMF1/EgtB/PvdO family nonheme iron enzyme [Vitreimonas sp.]|uniref:SUMF1/EgtB/PvdO family nonheme iron enzyme n=1 Tax=Vitreimonas sp. TaxID=3069702 RepID=UPI002D357DDE|nr:SUMF1/EgtB/PvdO family nonheme iron enzyme [Vitreimonas sp.]HYD87306.1 SUMF1/EgtB/PvdO family nonheme iron enzyme [Vitreimonas sp.]